MICFQISIFEPLETTQAHFIASLIELWFAFKLVSLNHWRQHYIRNKVRWYVVICFQISIFEPLETTIQLSKNPILLLWFAFKLVSLNHWRQLPMRFQEVCNVVICFQISIFEPLETTLSFPIIYICKLWFAFKLVSLNHWRQLLRWRFRVWSSCDLLSN